VLNSAAEASSLGPAKLVGEGDEMNSHRLSQLTVWSTVDLPAAVL
jgi:hypothetical protein